jgi:hypothetical protein
VLASSIKKRDGKSDPLLHSKEKLAYHASAAVVHYREESGFGRIPGDVSTAKGRLTLRRRRLEELRFAVPT